MDIEELVKAIRWLVEGAGIDITQAVPTKHGIWRFNFADYEYGHPIDPEDVPLAELVASLIPERR